MPIISKNGIKGVVLAGGKGTRLYPLTKTLNKNLLPVYNKPLIYYPLATLKEAGIKQILIISGPGHAGQFLELLGDGKEMGVELSYAIQPEPKGIAQGLGLAESFIGSDRVALILGDNIFEDPLKKSVRDFLKQPKGGKIILKKVKKLSEAKRFGTARFNGRKLVEIIEKPQKPPSLWIQTGFYLYDQRIFDIIKTLKPSARGEYEITDVNNWYLKEGTLTYDKIHGEWIDAGTFDALLKASNFIAKMERQNSK